MKKTGEEYFSYILTYVDNCLCIDKDPKKIIETLSKPPYNFKLKDVGPPKKYLGAEIGKYDTRIGET